MADLARHVNAETGSMAGTQKTLFITLQGEVYENETGKKRIDPLVYDHHGRVDRLLWLAADGSLCRRVVMRGGTDRDSAGPHAGTPGL